MMKRHFSLGIALIAAVVLASCAMNQNSAAPQPASQDIYNVVDYGAIGNGETLNSAAIQKAVDACAANGGGMVYIPAGEFVSGPIFLKSNVNFHISDGATLLGSLNKEDYPPTQGRYEGIERTIYASLLTGHDLTNVTISGQGLIDGRGEWWWHADEVTDSLREEVYGIMEREPENPPEAPIKWPRPRTINLYDSENILIEDITIKNSPSWTIHPVYCSNITVDNVTIINPADSKNTDGINPSSCTDVRISNCYIDVGDDCITLKSGYNEDGLRVGKPTENVSITNSTMIHGHGGVVIGSEMSGDVRNITISNCVFDGTQRGIRIKTMRGRGGVVEYIQVNNIVMRDIEEAFALNMFYKKGEPIMQPVNEQTPTIRRVHISDVTVVDAEYAFKIYGLPEMPVDDVSFRNIRVYSADKGVTVDFAKNVQFENVMVNTKGATVMSAHKAENLRISNFSTNTELGKTPVIKFDYVKNALIEQCEPWKDYTNYLDLSGGNNSGIMLKDDCGTDISNTMD